MTPATSPRSSASLGFDITFVSGEPIVWVDAYGERTVLTYEIDANDRIVFVACTGVGIDDDELAEVRDAIRQRERDRQLRVYGGRL